MEQQQGGREQTRHGGRGPGQEIVLGDVTVTRVHEYAGPVAMTPEVFFPESTPKTWEANASWLVPDFLDAETGIVQAALQTWVLRSEGRIILVDTGAGNHKYRPQAPLWSYLETAFLDNLARAGVRPEDVDIVVNTHLHVDHVGWNTRLDGREWVPTFPNATYLMPRRDFDFWNPENGHAAVLGRGSQNVFDDSVAPVHAAGQALLWDGSHDIDANLRLELAAGHTPGSSVLRLGSRGDRALFVGDLLHSPVQLLEPDVNSCFCEDPAESRATRRRVLGEAAEGRTLLFPAHFGGAGAAEVRREGPAFAVREWAAFAPAVPSGAAPAATPAAASEGVAAR